MSEETKEAGRIEDEKRVDEFAVQAFKGMGHKEALPDATVMIYNEMKRRKDRLQPSKLTPESFAIISVLGDLLGGISLLDVEKARKVAPESPPASGE